MSCVGRGKGAVHGLVQSDEYVHGLMKGEVEEMVKKGEARIERVVLC